MGVKIGNTEVPVWVLAVLGVIVAWKLGWLAGLSGLSVSQVGTLSQVGAFNQGNAAGAGEGGEVVEQAPELPEYALSSVVMYIKDKLDPKAGVPNVTVDVYKVDKASMSIDEMSAIATDPYEDVVDSAVSDSSGKVELVKGMIKVNQPYLYAIKGDSNVYDKLFVKVIPVPAKYFAVTTYTFDEPVYVYRVGAFADPSPDADNVLSGSEYPELNASGKSGLQYFEFDIEIGETDPGAVLKDPVLVLRTPEDVQLQPGAIKSIYIVRKEGEDLGIPVYNLVSSINSRPIKLKVGYDEEEGANIMTVGNSAVYTVKLSYDADLINNGDKIEIILDDLGDYRGQDIGTLNTKADPAKVVIEFVK